MNPQHTPGPWKAEGYNVRQSGQNGTRIIADVCYTGPHHTPPHEYPKSCRLVDEANARLIASAPELLNALQYQLDLMEWIETADTESPFYEQTMTLRLNTGRDYMESAIAKATGKETE
jgi:hypothetical protein